MPERQEVDRLEAENARLRQAILDIDANAVALAEDADGWIAVGYYVPIGPLHRSLGVIGHGAPKNPDVMPPEWFARVIERYVERHMTDRSWPVETSPTDRSEPIDGQETMTSTGDGSPSERQEP